MDVLFSLRKKSETNLVNGFLFRVYKILYKNKKSENIDIGKQRLSGHILALVEQ